MHPEVVRLRPFVKDSAWTDIAWDGQGNIFVTDGYTDSRVVKYDKSGRFIKAEGARGTGALQFNTPHGMVADAAGNVYVADRGNARIIVLEARPEDPPAASGAPTQYLYSSNSNDAESMDTGEICKVQLNEQVVGKFGKAGKLPRDLGIVNAIDCCTENDLWVGEIWNWRAQKVTLRR